MHSYRTTREDVERTIRDDLDRLIEVKNMKEKRRPLYPNYVLRWFPPCPNHLGGHINICGCHMHTDYNNYEVVLITKRKP